MSPHLVVRYTLPVSAHSEIGRTPAVVCVLSGRNRSDDQIRWKSGSDQDLSKKVSVGAYRRK